MFSELKAAYTHLGVNMPDLSCRILRLWSRMNCLASWRSTSARRGLSAEDPLRALDMDFRGLEEREVEGWRVVVYWGDIEGGGAGVWRGAARDNAPYIRSVQKNAMDRTVDLAFPRTSDCHVWTGAPRA